MDEKLMIPDIWSSMDGFKHTLLSRIKDDPTGYYNHYSEKSSRLGYITYIERQIPMSLNIYPAPELLSDLSALFAKDIVSDLKKTDSISSYLFSHYYTLPVNNVDKLINDFISQFNFQILSRERWFPLDKKGTRILGKLVINGDGINAVSIYVSFSNSIRESYFQVQLAYCSDSVILQEGTIKSKIDTIVSELDKICHIVKTSDVEIPKVNFLLESNGSLHTKQADIILSNFIPGNYNEEVVDGFEYLKNELLSPIPIGKIAILQGPPGGGKTHFIRSLISEIGAQVSFVNFPLQMIDSLNSSQLLSFFFEHKEDRGNKTMVLIIEDGEVALMPRETDNNILVNNMLNFSDGIYGASFDIRIIVSTNSDLRESDPAILRSGRLSTVLEFKRLQVDKCNEVLARLCKEADINPTDVGTITAPMMLADVYAKVTKFMKQYKTK